jgi:hypothetical protein
MSGDVSPENPQITDQNEKFRVASVAGRLIVDAAHERTDSPQFETEGYAFSMLDPSRLPQPALAAITPRETATDEDIARAKEASVKLSVEAAAQILEARPQNPDCIQEDSDSLQHLLEAMRSAYGVVNEQVVMNPQVVVKAAKEAIGKRKGIRMFEAAGGLKEEQLVDWADDLVQQASLKVSRMNNAIKSYLGH